MRLFQRVLSVFYFIGFALHVGDMLDLRLDFSEMTPLWQAWIIFLTVFDLIAAIGLWFLKPWETVAFQFVAFSQLTAYLGFKEFFGDQTFLVIFHIVTLTTYYFLKSRNPKFG